MAQDQQKDPHTPVQLPKLKGRQQVNSALSLSLSLCDAFPFIFIFILF